MLQCTALNTIVPLGEGASHCLAIIQPASKRPNLHFWGSLPSTAAQMKTNDDGPTPPEHLLLERTREGNTI